MSTRDVQFSPLHQDSCGDTTADDDGGDLYNYDENIRKLVIGGVGFFIGLAFLSLLFATMHGSRAPVDPVMEELEGIMQRAASCKQMRCNAKYNRNSPCQCNAKCDQFHNCCRDFTLQCGDDTQPSNIDTCSQLGCEGAYLPGYPCQCTTSCQKYKNCCSDYVEKCTTPPPPTPRPPPEAPVLNPDYHPHTPSLRFVSTAPIQTFYMYRVQADETLRSYPLENVNTASLGGVLWYLHNEIIYTCDWQGHKGHRKFDITRILRFKVAARAPQPLADKGLNFGVKCSFDSGACTGPAHQNDFDKYGFYIGCDYLGEYPHQEFQSGKKYPDAIWFSLPGPCPMKKFFESDDRCNKEQPGGHCKGTPTGAGDCTYTYEEAGQIDIDELVGITPNFKNREEFCRKGCQEGSAHSKGTCGLNFWDDIWNEHNNKERVERAKQIFKQKYPNLPGDDDLPPPKCDFSKGKYYS